MAKKTMKKKKNKNNQKGKILKKEHDSKTTKLYFGIGGILMIILIGLILFDAGIFEKEHKISKFSVDDECAIIMGNLIHNIRDEGDCKIKCMNNCDIRGLDFYNSEFTLQNTSCHDCDCYCK